MHYFTETIQLLKSIKCLPFKTANQYYTILIITTSFHLFGKKQKIMKAFNRIFAKMAKVMKILYQIDNFLFY